MITKFASILSRALFKFLKTGNLNFFSNNFLFELEISTPAFNTKSLENFILLECVKKLFFFTF